MHPYRKTFLNLDRTERTNTVEIKPQLRCMPPVKNVQLKCALTGGSTEATQCTKPNLPSTENKEQLEMVAVVVVTKCPCCKKTASKETVLMSSVDNDAYYHSFVENSIPGIIKFLPCAKCQQVKLEVVK